MADSQIPVDWSDPQAEVTVYEALVTHLETWFPGVSLSDESLLVLDSAAATIAEENRPGHEHEYVRLIEEGYSRWWSATVDESGEVIATDDEFSDDNDGATYLECDCGAKHHLSANTPVRWHGI